MRRFSKRARTNLIHAAIGVAFAVFGLLPWRAPDPNSEAAAQRYIEKRIRNWRPRDDDRTRPNQSIIVTDADIVGKWNVHRGLDGSGLSIRRKPPTDYSVSFSTGGCLNCWALQRTARFQNGVLTLNKPVVEYFTSVYDTLYLIRVNGEDLLLPAAFVSEFEACLANDQDHIMYMYVYRRAECDQAESN